MFESFTYHAAIALHVIVHGGRDWHHITEAQYKAVARALRAAVELDPRVQRRAVHQGRAVAAMTAGRRARLRVGQPALGPARAANGSAPRSRVTADRGGGRRGRRAGRARRRRVRGLHGRAARGRTAPRSSPSGVAPQRPVLGICVGMQVLFEAGVEHGVETAGLGVLPGRVERLRAPVLPHMGWNTVDARRVDAVRRHRRHRFYFVHSYAAHETSGS